MSESVDTGGPYCCEDCGLWFSRSGPEHRHRPAYSWTSAYPTDVTWRVVYAPPGCTCPANPHAPGRCPVHEQNVDVTTR